MTASLPAGLAGRANRAIDPLHSLVYFVPEAKDEFTRIGLRGERLSYFASRSAPMGPVPAAVTVATFYNFNPELVARHIPRAWTLAAPEDVLAARLVVADRALRRLLGDDVAGGPEVAELLDLTREATAGLRPEGRPLYAAHAELPWPDAPHLALWHAITLLREYRGDGHVAALLAAGLTGVEALVTHTLTGRGFTVAAAQATRGWSEDEWAAAEAALRERGLADGDGLTADGERVRAELETRTDELAAAPWRRLGVERTERLVELGKGLSRRAVAAGAFPDGVFAARR